MVGTIGNKAFKATDTNGRFGARFTYLFSRIRQCRPLFPAGGEKIGGEEVEATKSRVKSREEAKNSVTSMT